MKKLLSILLTLCLLLGCFTVTAFAARMPGDVDADGKVTASDARLALRRAVGLEDYASDSDEFLACDVDSDGTVTAGDARMILRAAVDLESLPGQEPAKPDPEPDPQPELETAAQKLIRFLTENGEYDNGGYRYYLRDSDGYFFMLSYNPDRDGYIFSLGGMNTSSQGYDFIVSILIDYDFSSYSCMLNIERNDVTYAVAVYNIDHERFEGETPEAYLTEVRYEGAENNRANAKSIAANYVALLFTWLMRQIKSNGLEIDAAKDLHLYRFDPSVVPVSPSDPPPAQMSAAEKIASFVMNRGEYYKGVYYYTVTDKGYEYDLMYDPSEDYISVGVVNVDSNGNEYIYLITMTPDFNTYICSLSISKSNIQAAKALYGINHTSFSTSNAEYCLTERSYTGNTSIRTTVKQLASAYTGLALSWLLTTCRNNNLGVSLSDLHLYSFMN